MSNYPHLTILVKAFIFAQKFVDKVESGKALSKETYEDMRNLLADIQWARLEDKAFDIAFTSELRSINGNQ